jgi:hypothetical protein
VPASPRSMLGRALPRTTSAASLAACTIAAPAGLATSTEWTRLRGAAADAKSTAALQTL